LDEAEDLAGDVGQDPYPNRPQRVVDLPAKALLLTQCHFFVLVGEQTAPWPVPADACKMFHFLLFLFLVLVEDDQDDDADDRAYHVEGEVLYF
jgi:hypothetical protein